MNNGHVTEQVIEPAAELAAPSAPETVDLRVVPTAAPGAPLGFDLPNGYLTTKYLVSRIGAGLLLVLLAPLFAAIALILRVQLGPGVLYRQARIGRGGKNFEILKFRTMLADRRGEILDRRSRDAAESSDRRLTHKSDEDPRHTRLGRFLRKTSLDELPQLWNVVRGDMTLIGPRPELAAVADRYDFRDHPRHVVVPGITGLWQVSPYRHDLLHEHLELDIEYVQQVSFGLDARIIGRTLLLFIRPSGR